MNIQFQHPIQGIMNDMQKIRGLMYNMNNEQEQVNDNPAFSPVSDVRETKDGYEIIAELPGLAKKDIKIEICEGMLKISGEKQTDTLNEQVKLHRQERSYGLFARSFTMPKGVDTESIKARFMNGVLYLDLPKMEAEKPRSIEIN